MVPIRLAVMDGDCPLICSVWFLFSPEESLFRCVSHGESQLIKLLRINPRVGFEIALNEPPYKGVRGKGVARLTQDGVADRLNSVILRFLGDTASGLAKWLLGRSEQEYVIEISPDWITSWDYSERMT